MLREGLALLSCVSLHHAHRPATGEGGGLQPLAIDSRGMQIKHRSFGGISDMRPALSSLMQISHSKASSDRDESPENSINVDDAEIRGRINSSCEGIMGSDVSTWDENCEASKTRIKHWAELFRDNPRNFKNWKSSMVGLEASPLKFKECHDAWRSGVEALKNMTSEDIQRKFGSVEKMEDYKWVAQKLSIKTCEEEDNFRDVLDLLAAGKDGSLPLNPEVCYIVRAMAPQRFWKKGMGNRGLLDLGESQAYSEKPGDGGVFHSVILDAHAAMTKRWEESLVKVGLRVRKDMKELANEIYYEENPSRKKPFCEGNWETATQACKEEAKAAIKSDPMAALPQLFEGRMAMYDEMPTAENAGIFHKLSILSSTLNDPEVHAVFVGALEKQAKLELRIWKPEVTDFVSAHKELSSEGSFIPRMQVLESQEESFENAGLQEQFKELTEEVVGKWNMHINEMMEKLMHDKGFTMTVPEAGSKVTLEKLEELVRLSKYTKEQLEDHRFIIHCVENDTVPCQGIFNYKTLFRYLPDEGARNDPKMVAAALRKEAAFQNVDPLAQISADVLLLLANPELWKDDELMNLYIDTYITPELDNTIRAANEDFRSVGLRLRGDAPAQFQKVLQAAEAGTEIAEDCQHTLREIFGSKEAQAQSLVEERPPHGYLCEGLSPLTLCMTRREEYKLSFDCHEDKLIVTSFTDEHEGIQFRASLDEDLTSIPKSHPFGVELEVPAGIPGKYTLHGILDDGNVNKVRLHVFPSSYPERFPDGANFLYDLETCQTLKEMGPPRQGFQSQKSLTETIMLTYGGNGASMGKGGSFDSSREWFGFKQDLLLDNVSSSEAFQSLREESLKMSAAIVRPFPVPRYKSGTGLRRSVLQEIARLDAIMTQPNEPDKVTHINELMEPGDIPAYVSRGAKYYLYGPFIGTQSLIEGLQADPMLKPVYEKWSKFDSSILDKVFKYGALYLQIRWEGWFVRPVLEMNELQFCKLLFEAREEVREAGRI